MKFTVSNDIKLTEIRRALAWELQDRLTLPNRKYDEAVQFGRSTRDLDPSLHFWRSIPGGLSVPRGAAKGILETSEKYGKVEIIDQRRLLPEINLEFQGALRAYQQQAVQGILAKDFGVLEAGTGSGKTVMALFIIAARKQPTLVLVHNKELLHQWKDRIKTFLGADAGLVGAGKFDIQPITVGIVNTVKKHLSTLPKHFGHLVVDECHRVPSSLFSESVAAFDSRYMLGLSATPYRRDGLDKLIIWYLGIHRVPVEITTLHQVGAVLRPKIIKRETDFRYFYEDDYSRMISALAADPNRNRMIAADVRVQAQNGGLSLVVSDRVAHLEELAELSNTDHAILTGKTPLNKRREIVEGLDGGHVPVLFSTLSLIGEGFDCPSMDTLFLATPIKFSGRLKQVVGRVLRPAEGKEAKVFDYVDSNVGLLNHQAKSRQRVFNEM